MIKEDGSVTSRESPRIIKVFISSTFRDFQRERDELVKKTFPALRDYCAQRRVLFIDVDLRWGITEEQAEAGEILPICLEEIDNSRPFFIGLLGERYGWVPARLPSELSHMHPWLEEHRDKSITELEILYGALENTSMEGKRFFYFRSPTYHECLPPKERRDYLSSDDPAAEKLQRLKERIRQESARGRLRLVESYRDPAELAELVYEDLRQAIDAAFPEEGEYDELAEERLAQQTFVDSRIDILVERTEVLEALIRRLHAQPLPVVVAGEPGSGKTSMLARLAKEMRDAHPEAFIFTNFVGVSPDSSDYIQILKRLLNDTPGHRGSENAVPEGSAELVRAFPGCLEDLPPEQTVYILLDGLDQIADVEGALDLEWLPDRFPHNVHVVVSASSASTLTIFSQRAWPIFELPRLAREEQHEMTLRYLGQYGKRLDAEQIDRILETAQTTLPLYLRAFLEEIRIFGDFARLNDRIGYYLAARDTVDLYDKILQRLEEDYDGTHPGLVRRAFSLLAASRAGLNENELRDMLNVPRAVWSHLYRSIQESLTNTIGYITFFHEFLRRAVEERYLPTTEDRKAAHKDLAEYFATTADLDRKAEELPWQLEKAEEWAKLRDCVSRFDVFTKLMRRGRQQELLSFWSKLQPRYDLGATYVAALDRYEATNPSSSALQSSLEDVSTFLTRCGLVREVTPILQRIKELDDKTFEVGYLGELEERRLENLLALSENLMTVGQFEEAEGLLAQSEEVWKRLPDRKEADRARILNSLGYLQKSLEKNVEAEKNYRAAMALDPRPTYASNLATLLKELGRFDEAERIYRRSVEGSSPDDWQRAAYLANLGDVLQEKGDLHEAEECYRAAVESNRALLGPEHFHLGANLCRLAELLMWSKRPAEAQELVAEAIAIFQATLGPEHPRSRSARELGMMIDIAKSLHDRA